DAERLAEVVSEREGRVACLVATVAESKSKLKAARENAQETQQQSQQELEQRRQRHLAAEQALANSIRNVESLRLASEKARGQIDSLLVRLPGSSQEFS